MVATAIIRDRQGNPLTLGAVVEHATHYLLSGEPDLRVVSLDTERLPLIGIDCGDDFTRWIPHMDLVVKNI